MSTSDNETYTVVSLFTGAMGLDIGLEETGRFETHLAVDANEAACETIRMNRDAGRTTNPDLEVINADLGEISPQEVFDQVDASPEDVDLLSGGPPCVSFSTAGDRRTLQDARGELIFDYLDFVEYIKPDFFLMENVRGLMSAAIQHRPTDERPKNGGPPLEPEEKPGSVLKLWLRDLMDIGNEDYRIDIFEVNSANYGAPQIRERVLFIGNRHNIKTQFPRPTHYNVPKEAGSSTDEESTSNKLNTLSDKEIKPFNTLADAIKDLEEDDPVIMDFSPRKKKYLKKVPPGGNWRTLPEELQKESMGAAYEASGGRSGWWRRLSYDYPTPTILGQPNHSSSALCHPEEVRALTLRECALVQEFPEDWEFAGTPAEQYKQVGNAVPITLGRVAGETIAEHLDQVHQGDAVENSRDYPKARKVYINSHVRRRYWYKDGDTVVNEDSNGSEVRYELPDTKIDEEIISFAEQQKQSSLEKFS